MLRRTLPALLVLLAVSGCGGESSGSQAELQKQFEAIQSLAAEGALVADGAAEGRATDAFVRVHTGYLDEAAQKIATKLSSGANDRDRARAARLAEQVAGRLASLSDNPDDRAQARRIASQLRRDAALAERQAG
jgi:hypothetical protein